MRSCLSTRICYRSREGRIWRRKFNFFFLKIRSWFSNFPVLYEQFKYSSISVFPLLFISFVTVWWCRNLDILIASPLSNLCSGEHLRRLQRTTDLPWPRGRLLMVRDFQNINCKYKFVKHLDYRCTVSVIDHAKWILEYNICAFFLASKPK